MQNNIKVTLLSFFLSFTISIADAQETPLKIEANTNTNKSVDFNYTKSYHGTYTVVVTLNSLSNAANSQTEYTAYDYSGRLFTLTPINKDQGIGYSYRYSFIRGKLKPKYSADFVYLLPYKKGVNASVAESNFVGATYFGNTTPDDWKVYRFYTQKEDTVTAVRKGVVVEIKDLFDNNETTGVAFTTRTNSLTIEHADGTLATYRGFKKGSFVVKEGQTVFPETALGLNSRYDINGKFNISLMISYLKSADLTNKGSNMSNSKSFYGFITPHFNTTEGANIVLTSQNKYTAANSPEIIQKEMTKRELKLRIK
jgi:hypothetical protein